MQFKVPQFLDIEDKIFGPFTFKEFVYLAGGAGLCFVLYRLLGFVVGIIPILAVASFSIALAKYRPNNKPFIDMLEAGFVFLTQSRLYIWEKRKKEVPVKKQIEKTSDQTINRDTVRLGGNKLRDLAWSLDVLDLSKQENQK